jgi:hypothetical protein
MARPKKNIIKLDVDSSLALMQEIYNDVVGPVIKEQQKIMNDCTEKKISLVKLQQIIVKQMNSSGQGNGIQGGGKLELTDEDRELIEKLAESTSTGGNSANYKTK